jgi:hypothetical protein
MQGVARHICPHEETRESEKLLSCVHTPGGALNGLSEPGQSRYALREWRPYLIDAHSMHPPAVTPEHLGCPVQACKCVSPRVHVCVVVHHTLKTA